MEILTFDTRWGTEKREENLNGIQEKNRKNQGKKEEERRATRRPNPTTSVRPTEIASLQVIPADGRLRRLPGDRS